MQPTQPQTQLIKTKHIAYIKMLLDNKLEDAARAYDKTNKVNYFASLDAAGKPQYEQWLNRFITVHPEMLKLKEQVKTLMNVDDTVLITGETGTGKELIARALHGNRNAATFVAINCAGLPEYLLESELFGHERGAFTGADKVKAGLLKEAAFGTVFLDEIGDMPYQLQAKLLRAIQEKTIRKVGSNVDEPITCRFVSATHHQLKTLIDNKLFRQDLYERLSTFEINTLPIRERVEDIALIVESLDPDNKFPKTFNWYGIDHTIKTHPSVYIPKLNVDLSGNVRSIQKIIRRYLVLGQLPK